MRKTIRVYRGQLIATDELELMKKSVGEFLSMNSFLSTSRDRSIALRFARLTPVVDGAERIIFEIEIDPRLPTKAFADITQSSYFQNENEVLIALGALFRIETVTEDKKDRMWTVRVSLASEDDFHLKEIFAFMKETIGEDTDLDSLGKILIEMGEYEQAQRCYERMLQDLQVKTGDCHMGLGKTHVFQKQDGPAMAHLEHAKKVRQELQGPNHRSVGEVYTYIGGLQWNSLENYDEALVNLKKAVTILEEAEPCDFITLSRAYNNMAATYYCRDEYKLALEHYNKCLTIQQRIFPPNHARIATTYNNLGILYKSTLNYAKAMEFYRKSLAINRQILPPTHEDMVRTENNIRRLQDKMKN
jgi:tetratricopeptide (TPR) repeat protein